MGKNNRQRRKEKLKRNAKKRTVKKNKRKLKNNDGFVVTQIENPFVGISLDDRKKIISEVQEAALDQYTNALSELEKISKECNPLLLLSFLSNYYLMGGVSENGISSFQKEEQVNQADIELFQAIVLQQDPKYIKFDIPTRPEINQNLVDTLGKLSTASHHKNMKAEFLDLGEKENAVKLVQEFVKAHTQTVRNWGSFDQVKTISGELYSVFDTLLLAEYGFESSDVIELFDYLIKIVEDRASHRFQNLQNLAKIKDKKHLIEKYLKLIGNDIKQEEITDYLNKVPKEDVFFHILAHYDLLLLENYVFELDDIVTDTDIDIDRVKEIIKQFSYSFGGLKGFKSEYLFLGNPIWTKPIILLGEKSIFCPIPQLFFSFIIKAFDSLIEKIDAEKLSGVKADYLEKKVEEIVKRRFPETNTIQSLKWKHDGKEFETDLITFIDSYAIIFEVKSGKITDEALRGAEERLKRKVNELLVEPNIQSKRLKDKLEFLIENPGHEDKIRDKLPVDLNKIKKVLRVSVALEYFASLQSNVMELETTGWIPSDYTPCPTMNISDFETLFDIFDHPVQIINYLEQREEIEGKIKYQGDELDLIGVYLDTHFNFSGIDPNMLLNISHMSTKLDHYYQAKEAGVSLEKPKPKMNRYFEKVIEQVESREIEGWTQIGSIIYRLFPEDQTKIINLLNKLKGNVRKNWMKPGHENILVYIPPLSSKYAFSFVVFCDENKEKRHDFLDEAIVEGLKADHVEHCLGIGINIDRNDLPYTLIGVAHKDENI